MKYIREIIIVVLIVLMSGCGARKSEVHKSEIDKVLKENTVINTKEEVKETVTTEIDTSVTIAENTIEGGKPASDVLNGQSLVVENDFIKSETYYDKPSGQLKNRTTQKKREVPIKQKQIIQRNIKRDIKQDKKSEERLHEKTKDKTTDRKGINMFTVAGGIVFFLLFLWLIIFLIRKSKKAANPAA